MSVWRSHAKGRGTRKHQRTSRQELRGAARQQNRGAQEPRIPREVIRQIVIILQYRLLIPLSKGGPRDFPVERERVRQTSGRDLEMCLRSHTPMTSKLPQNHQKWSPRP